MYREKSPMSGLPVIQGMSSKTNALLKLLQYASRPASTSSGTAFGQAPRAGETTGDSALMATSPWA